MKSQWPLTNEEKYGAAVIAQSKQINSVVGTDIPYGGCVGGLIALWFIFRFLTVVSLTV